MRHSVTAARAAALALLSGLVPAVAPAAPGPRMPADRADPSLARHELGEAAPRAGADAPPVQLQPSESGAAVVAAGGVLVGAVQVEGASEIPPAAFAEAIQTYLGRQLGPGELRRLATDVAGVARRAGYGLATAEVPRQVIQNGILKVVVDEGRVDAVEVDGSGAAAVRRILARLVTGRPVRTADLERQLLLAGDVAGVSTAGARIDRRDGRNILKVTARRDAVTARVGLDNWGSAAIGPVRARIDIDLNSVLTADDRVSIGGLLTPLDPREFQFIRAAWSVPVNGRGTELSVAGYYGHSKPGGSLKSRNLDGNSLEADFTLSHPLLRSRSASLWGSVELAAIDSDLDEQGARIRSDRIRTVTAGVNGVGRLGKGWLRGQVSVVQGVSALGATAKGDPRASRSDAGGVFTKTAFSAQYASPLGGRFSASLGMEGQLASRPLLSSEEMGLGGGAFLRGYDYWEVSGDEGVAGSAELRYDLGALFRSLRRFQIYTYADAGTVSNLQSGLGGGSLASAGGGLRITLRDGFEAGAELGVPLKSSPFTPSPPPRFSFTLGYGF